MIRFTRKPKRGDAVIGNLETKKVLFVRQDTLNSVSDVDTSKYEIIGVVVCRKGIDVLIAYKANASKTWCDRYSSRLTGYTLDGTSRTGVLSIREASNSWASNVAYTVSYNASTAAELVEQLNTFFQDTTNPVFQTQDWCAKQEDDGSITLHFAYTSWQQVSYNTGTSGFALTANLLPDVTALANMRRKHGGGGGEGAISSWDRALAYFRSDNSSTTYNPDSNVTDIRRGYPICLPGYLGTSQYQSDHCAALRAVYGEGEQGWLHFMASCRPVRYTDFGNMGMTDGLERTKLLASKTYSSLTKSESPLCQAASYCYNTETVCIPKGNWFLGTTRDIDELLDGIHYGTNGSRTADPLNATLYKLGGSAISNGSYVWSCLRYSSSYAWLAVGGGGFFYDGHMYYSHLAVPLSLYKLA